MAHLYAYQHLCLISAESISMPAFANTGTFVRHLRPTAELKEVYMDYQLFEPGPD